MVFKLLSDARRASSISCPFFLSEKKKEVRPAETNV